MSSGNRREDTRGWFGFVLNRACWIPSGAIPSVLGGHGPPYPSHPCFGGHGPPYPLGCSADLESISSGDRE